MSKKTPMKKELGKTAKKIYQKRITAFGHHGGETAKKLAQMTYAKKKAITPADWPENCVVDDRWCSWLPEDWTPAAKMTEGGLLLLCYIGPAPDRKRFFHKKDLEAYVERSLGSDERGTKPPELGDIDPKSFVKRTEVVAQVDYINVRCEKAHGLSVEEALATSCEHTHGKQKNYTVADLKYDLLCKRLTLVPERPSQSSKPTIAPTTPTRRPCKSAAPATPRTPIKVKKELKSAGPKAPATPAKCNAKPLKPVTPKARTAAVGSSRGSSSSSSSSFLEVLFKSCSTPLKSRAASGMADETSIFALIGIGGSLGLDRTMLSSLPEILRKPPAERGEFGQFVLNQFEKKFSKHS